MIESQMSGHISSMANISTNSTLIKMKSKLYYISISSTPSYTFYFLIHVHFNTGRRTGRCRKYTLSLLRNFRQVKSFNAMAKIPNASLPKVPTTHLQTPTLEEIPSAEIILDVNIWIKWNKSKQMKK